MDKKQQSIKKKRLMIKALALIAFVLFVFSGSILAFFENLKININQNFIHAPLEDQLAYAPISSHELLITQENTLLPITNPLVIQEPKAKRIQKPEPRVARRIKMTITAYSSTYCQTDSTPFITASNSHVRWGIVANNFFPFGTRIRIPEYFGDEIFVVEDRMHWRKSNYHVDIWFHTKKEAINFGITRAYVEILAER